MNLEYLYENWQIILGIITTPVAWFFGGKSKQKTDAVTSMQVIYDGFLEHFKSQMKEVVDEMALVKDRNHDLQKQFNDLYIQYSKELEASNNWKNLHDKMKKQYDILKGDYDALKKDHDKLKKDFDNYKKNNK